MASGRPVLSPWILQLWDPVCSSSKPCPGLRVFRKQPGVSPEPSLPPSGASHRCPCSPGEVPLPLCPCIIGKLKGSSITVQPEAALWDLLFTVINGRQPLPTPQSIFLPLFTPSLCHVLFVPVPGNQGSWGRRMDSVFSVSLLPLAQEWPPREPPGAHGALVPALSCASWCAGYVTSASWSIKRGPSRRQ